MKDQLASLLRHAFTGWIAAIVLFLTAKLALGPDDVKAVESALNQIGAGLLLLIVTLAPIVGRLAWAWVANAFRLGAGEPKGGTSNGTSGGTALFLLVGTTVGCLGFLPSCSPGQLSNVPIRIGIEGPDMKASYSSKGGLQVDAVIRPEK